MAIPTVYSIQILQFHTKQYDNIFSNVSLANSISVIVKNDIPSELWMIVCGKKGYLQGDQWIMINNIKKSLATMSENAKSQSTKTQLEVASRTCLTLSNNIVKLENQIESEASVSLNEALLDEIRTITDLFYNVMQNYIIYEIENLNTSTNAIRRSSIIIFILQLSLTALILALSIWASFTVFNSFAEPISNMQKLSDAIAQGNLSARTSIPNVKELEPFATNMNKMAEQIEGLIEKNTEEQKNFQKAEMKALQAQMTPHFLYNTLDTIIWLAEQEDTERVVKITKAFADFLRTTLSRGHEWITIKQELDHIKNYLTIQKIRYADILNYEIFADEELMDYKIIKLCLQPLVENAIYHGIKNKRGRGHLTVRAWFTDETKKFIRFEVQDDGAGFSPERLQEVKDEMGSGEKNAEKLTSVYGIYNVNKKLKLYYGDNTDGLVIQSNKGKGSSITFDIPTLTGE